MNNCVLTCGSVKKYNYINGVNLKNNTTNISFKGSKVKNLQKTLDVIGNYGKAQTEIKQVVKDIKKLNNGSIVKYFSDGSIIVESSGQLGEPIKSRITTSITKEKDWKSSPERSSFLNASTHYATRGANTHGIKKITDETPLGEKYIQKGYTHEVKAESDSRMFGRQLDDGTYEWSLFEHSKLHKKKH